MERKHLQADLVGVCAAKELVNTFEGGPIMGIIRGIKDFLEGFQETVAADREMMPQRRSRWPVFVVPVVVLSVLIWVLIATIR
jgi:hypothetical protein